jgi:fibronectin-binding autotransporter adhesin
LALFGSAIASATGIDAGGGDNRVYNYGTLSVTAQPIAILGASDSRARGILTGEGSDTIVNAGKILTSQYTSSLTETPGTAISTGGGNDRVFLEAGSETRGLIDLGSGDDTISFNGQLTLTGSVIGGPGNNTLVFSGNGALEAPISGFETAIKNGPGTYTLSSLAQVKRLEMNGGTLAVNHSYQMPADGVFQARVNGDGSHGQFFVNGVAGLDGSLSVVRGKGVFTNGAKFPILTANTVNGWFTSENLPAPSPLLSFKATGFSNRVEVEALAKSCTTIATNPVQMRVAQMLDKAMATATGSTAEMLGEFQSLPAQDFQKAFASLNPSIYDRFRKASLTASRENLRSLHNRMTALRLTHPDYSAAVQAQTIANTMSLFMTGPDSGMDPDQAWQLGRISSAEARNGSWMSAFGQRGGFAGASGYAGYDYRMNGTVIGYDQRHGETLITGFSNGFNRGEVSIEDKMGLGSISGASSSMYSSWFSDGMYMEGAFSLARNIYTNHRSIVVGSFSQSAASEHEGNLFTAYLSSGRYVDVNQWVVEPYASMLFTQTYEDGFQETGGGLSLRIHDDRTRSLSTDVGLRVARSYEMPFGKLIPEAGVAWIYDFQLDDRSITASFTDVAGSEFSIPGEQTGRHGARFEAGLSLLGNNGLSASLRYTGEFRSGADDQGFFGYLRYEF